MKLTPTLDIRIKVIKSIIKTLKTILTMSLDEENIVDVSKPYKRLKLLSL